MINWQLSKKDIRWPVSPDRTAGSSVDPSRSSTFLKLSADKLPVSNDRRLKFTFFQWFILNLLCLCHYGPALLRFWFQTDLGSENSSSFFKSTGGEDLILPWSRVGHALRRIFILWLVKIWQVSSCEKIMQHLENCLLWQLKLKSFVSTCDVFNCLFPLNIVQNEIQLLSRVCRYSWLVCLSGLWLRITSLVKVGNPISDGIVFVFHLAWCVRGLKSLKRFWPYLIVFSASRMVSLSNYCICVCFFICI